jgi:polysaccharide biosynthesis protein PslJ
LSAPALHHADLEPALTGDRTYVTRRRLPHLDAATVFAIMIVLLTVFPTVLVVPNTSADIGRPAVILCMGMFCWWLGSRCHPRLVMAGPQPIRWAVLIFMLSLLVSYAAGFQRGLTAMESNAADRLLLSMIAFIGAVLLAADGPPNWDRMLVALKVFVWCAVFMSLIGMLQAVLPFDPVEYLTVPGLQAGDLIGLQARGSGVRVAATTTHYLELCGTLALAWPVALHLATHADTPRLRRRYLVASVVITVGILETISRTGIVAIVIATAILMPLWSWRKRYNTLVLGVGVFAVLAVVTPSMARTVFNLFADASDDPSITARTERLALVGFYFPQHPWLGRGSGTWVPPMYQYLDNQWMRTALENGVVGVAALALLHLTALMLALTAFRRARTPADRHLCLALVAVQVMAIFIAYTFDVLAYSTYTTMLGIMTGLCGAAWRFTHPTRKVRTSIPHWFGR